MKYPENPTAITPITHRLIPMKIDEIVKIRDTRVQAIDNPQKYQECLEYPTN